MQYQGLNLVVKPLIALMLWNLNRVIKSAVIPMYSLSAENE